MSRPLFVRKLKKPEFAQITRLIRSKEDARIVRRAQMIRLSSQGKKASEICEMWGVTIATVLRTIQNFNAAGLDSLADKPRKGRPRKTTERYIILLKEAVQKSPRDFGYPFSSWTLERLREHLGRLTGTLLNPRYLSQLMARHGIVYRRPKHLMDHLRDSKDYNEKKAILEFLKNAQSKGTPASPLSTLTNVKFTCTRP
jgi:transposase